MDKRTIIVANRGSAFAHHARLLGLCVVEAGEPPGTPEQWGAIFWDMLSMDNIIVRNRVMTTLLKAPKTCTRILDFNLASADAASKDIVRQSLAHCDLLKTDEAALHSLCMLFGIDARYTFDSCSDLMAAFGMKTLILTHGRWGCHVFQGNAVSEKMGHLAFGKCTTEEAEGAFTAAYYNASREQGLPFTEYHRKALDYLTSLCSSVR